MQDTSWLRLLLNSLRYLPHIKEAKNLTTKLLDILDIATMPVQLEILESIPEVLPDSQYSETARQLSKLLEDNEELSGAIIDCLNALNLDADIRLEVHEQILTKILNGTSLKNFPILLQFLLTECKSQNLVPTLLKIRDSLDTIMLSSNQSKEKESCKILIFNRLQAFAISPKTITEAWLNMISGIRVHSDHKPVDYLILFMLHATVKFKKKIIEAIFRKRIHMGLFKIGPLEKLLEKYMPAQLLKDYFGSIVEIGCNLLRSSTEYTVVEFVKVFFTTLFNHKYTDTIYRREMLDSLILLTGASEKKSVGHVLKIISSLLSSGDRLRQHTALLMCLLEKLDSLELKDIKEVFEILCTLTCGEQAEESMSGLKDEIHMLIRKQLSSSKRIAKTRGIIGAVAMAKHLVLKSEEQINVELPSENLEIMDLPRGSVREAAMLLDLAHVCTVSCPELMGLYYDQITSMFIVTNHFDKYFLAWLHETITHTFKSLYMIEMVPNDTNGLKLSKQLELNTADQVISSLAINIAGLTVDGDNNILLLASHFRLLRLVHYRLQAGDLCTLGGLLGCSVIMPDFQDIIDLDTDQVALVADCLFHCINWFRELMNGYITQKNKKLRAKVAQRLQDIIDLEKKLYECMERLPDHKLPVSYFDSLTETKKQMVSPLKHEKKNLKKRFKSAPVVNDANDTVASTSAAPLSVKKKKTVTKTPEFHIIFREMDPDLVLLFKYPLRLDNEDGDPSQYTSCTTVLNIDQVKFILSDHVVKLQALTKGKDMGLSHLNVVAPISIISDSTVVLPNIDMHFKVILKRINKLLEVTDGRHDLPEMFTEEALKVKACFGHILDIFYLTFSWAGFQFSSNLEVLKTILKSMRSDKSQTPNSANRLIIDFLNRSATYYEQCLQLSHAVSLIKMMEALYGIITSSTAVEKKIASVAEKLLSNRWYNSRGAPDSGRECNANIEVLVKVYLKCTDINTLSGLVGTLQEQAPTLNTKEDCLHMLVSIDKQNFHVLYAEICNALLARIKTEIQSLTNNQHLILWRNVTLIMQGLMFVSKVRETTTILATFLKKSNGILNIFLSHGIPILEIMLRSKPNEVVEIFKMMQNCTRYLHTLCCYSKLKKEKGLMAFVPKFRMTLETLVYRVKATLVANNCTVAFWMGNLRNKDLQGEEILSQSTVVTEYNDNHSEEELPADESEVDVSDGNASDSRESTESEVF